MKQIKYERYQIIGDTDICRLCSLVREQLDGGWKLQGGVSNCCDITGKYIVTQALYKPRWWEFWK